MKDHADTPQYRVLPPVSRPQVDPAQVFRIRRMWQTCLLQRIEIATGSFCPANLTISAKLTDIATLRRQFLEFTRETARKRNDIGFLCDMAGIDRDIVALGIRRLAANSWPDFQGRGRHAGKATPLAAYVADDGSGFYCTKPPEAWSLKHFLLQYPYPDYLALHHW